MFALLSVGAWAADETVTFSEQGYENGQEVSSYTGNDFTVTFDKGTNSNTPKYYNTGAAIRVYGGGYFTVSSSTKTITQIVVGFGSGDGSNEIMTNVGTYDSGSWIGSASSVKFTVDGTTGHRRIASIAVTYEGGQVTLPAPTFNPAGGTYYEAQTVEISGPAGATIYYTTNGNDPTTSSAVYSAPIAVNQTTTIKAIANNGELTSAVATATYTISSIQSVPNIAAYYALGEGAYASISNPVTVYYSNGSNVWVKDETGYLLIFGQIVANKGYQNGDIIPGGFGGYLKNYNNLFEMTTQGAQTLFGFQDATAGPAVAPEVATTAAVVEANIGHYITIENATISDISGKNFTVNDAAGTANGYNQYSGVSIPNDGATYNITGIVSIYNTNIQFQPTAFEKVVNLDDLPKVDNIAGLLATEQGTDVMFNNPVTAVYHSGNQLYIKDNSGYMLVYGHLDNSYNNGDQLNGIAGNWTIYNGMTEMVPIASTFGEATPGTPVTPETLMIEEISQDLIHNYLRIENCSIDSIEGTQHRNYTLTDETGDIIMRLNFNEVTIGEDFDYDAEYNVEGFLAYFKKSDGTVEQLQFYPNLIEKVGGGQNPPIPGDVNGDTYVTSADVTLLYNIMLNNDYTGVVYPDQNGDGVTTSADVTTVYNIILGQTK